MVSEEERQKRLREIAAERARQEAAAQQSLIEVNQNRGTPGGPAVDTQQSIEPNQNLITGEPPPAFKPAGVEPTRITNNLPIIIRDERGRPSGVRFPDGRVIANISPEDVQAIIGVGGGSVESEEARAADEQAEKVEKARALLEEQGFFEDQRPTVGAVDLSANEPVGLEKFPIIGPTLQAGAGEGGFIGPNLRNLLSVRKDDPEIEPLIQDPATARQLVLQEIQRETIKQGLTVDEKIGAQIESWPVVGTAATKWVGGMIQSPRANVDTIMKEVGLIGQQGTNTREKVLEGKVDPWVGVNDINNMENRLAHLEQRIKLLSLSSSELIADADALNVIEANILDTKQRLFDAKTSAAAGAIKEPTDGNAFIELKKLKGG